MHPLTRLRARRETSPPQYGPFGREDRWIVPGDLPQLFVALGIFAGAVVSGFTGFAFSAVAGAVLLHVMPPREAVPLMMVCSVLVQSMSLVSLRPPLD